MAASGCQAAGLAAHHVGPSLRDFNVQFFPSCTFVGCASWAIAAILASPLECKAPAWVFELAKRATINAQAGSACATGG